MKIKSLLCLSMLSLVSLSTFAAASIEPNRTLLPEAFHVFTNGITVINHPAANFVKKLLPTNNDFTGYPGCYVACYSHQKENAIYAVSNDIFVMGQVRVPGKYEQRVCQPTLFSGIDISASNTFKAICQQKIKACKDISCWAGGDTGGWFGIQ